MSRHYCIGPFPPNCGEVISSCRDDEQGRLFVSNGFLQSQVNFCPYCGEAAHESMRDIPLEEYNARLFVHTCFSQED